MAGSNRRRVRAALIGVAALIAAAMPVPAQAADFEVVLPAGLACEFELMVAGTGGATVTREFTDANGNIVRTLTAGRGQALTFTNVSTGESVSLRSNGAVTTTTFNADGSSTLRSTGHNVIILFPSDVPAGPTTTLYVGRVTYDVDAQNTFTLTGFSGTARDICAELS
jgi:hypothetical protein